MKKKLGILAVCLYLLIPVSWGKVSVFADSYPVRIDQESFPDDAFRAVVSGYDLDQDGTLSGEEAQKVTSMDVHEKEIDNSRGLEYFTKLKSLDISYNNLLVLDLSKNTELQEVNCGFNQLVSLNVTKNKKLNMLYCSMNQLTKLDVSKNTELKELYCADNIISGLQVVKNTKLVSLFCESNSMTTLNLTKNTRLVELGCYFNYLTRLDLSGQKKLEYLDCSLNRLRTLKITSTKITELYADDNRLTLLDVTTLPQLRFFTCSDNQLTTLNTTNCKKLETLYCSNNKLSTLDLSKNKKLVIVSCESNQLTAVDLTNNKKVIDLKDGAQTVTLTPIPQGDAYLLKLSGQKSYDKSRVKNLSKGRATDNGIVLSSIKNIEKVTYKYQVRMANQTKYVQVTIRLRKSAASGIGLSMPAPEIRADSCAYNQIKLAWKKVSSAEGYILYRAVGDTEEYKKIKTISKSDTLYYIDTGLKTNTLYSYKLRSYKTEKNKRTYSADSVVVSAKPQLEKPIVHAYAAGLHTTRIYWEETPGAAGYEIYRSRSQTGTFTKVQTISKKDVYTYADTDVKMGKTYYYKVRSYRKVSGKKQYSAYSSLKTVPF